VPIDPQALQAYPFPEVRSVYTARDSILYALSVGFGSDPCDAADLRFVYEKHPEFAAVPSMAVVLGSPGIWIRDPRTGIDWRRALHGEERLRLFRSLPPEGEVIGRTRITAIVDKGAGRGALVTSEREITDAASGALLATVASTVFCRGDGGFGAGFGNLPAPHRLPERPPDRVLRLDTFPQQALLYRLNGDDNPLHADPAVAREAGFSRPILHGRATFGMLARGIMRSCCGTDPVALTRVEGRFSAPLYPGEAIRLELWQDGGEISFRARAETDGRVVMDNGLAVIGGGRKGTGRTC